ncbi:MAG: hypothetical protein K2L28_05960 [Muribaculaceae bacterium]|nr:hypothetical protein [Muribaculaceae bacterium]
MATHRTQRFSVSVSAYVDAMALHRLMNWSWAVIIVVIAAGVAGFGDSRYWYLGLMLLLIVYHLALTFTWVAVARRDVVLITHPQEWLFDDADGITVYFYPFEGDDDAEPEASLHIPKENIKNAAGSRFVKMEASGIRDKLDFLLIPANEVPCYYFDFL